MTDETQERIEDSDTLIEFIEMAENNYLPETEQASQLIHRVWERDIPEDRVVSVLKRERERLEEYQAFSISESSRAPRYMDLNDLELISGHQFEHVLAEVLRRVEGDAKVTGGSGDQGVDIVWSREDETIAMQAKAYDLSNPVGNSAVQEIHTGSEVLQSKYSIDISAVITTSQYTEGAREAAEKSGVTLFDRQNLKKWLSEAELDAETMGDILDNIE